ncbi:PREDICTED: uncharacterized protein LOC109164053 [Ipomoea nil]|uniref:uncharacterized protein LOC109164053 n=1 Tax=Ipomoea nil TaxID=35883 RepID=UPI000901CF6E|nr:PREDICTED: uncharacterized protein LOC109164053 [Ipomoea nil]
MSKKASCGGVARNEHGEWLKGFSYALSSCSAKMAEAWVILKGIKFVKTLVSNNICFECNSKMITYAISQGARLDSTMNNILDASRRELSNIRSWHLGLVPRDINHAADHLAKMRTRQKGDAAYFEELKAAFFQTKEVSQLVQVVMKIDCTSSPW